MYKWKSILTVPEAARSLVLKRFESIRRSVAHFAQKGELMAQVSAQWIRPDRRR
jgi:hypothetical protein